MIRGAGLRAAAAAAATASAALIGALALATALALEPPPAALPPDAEAVARSLVLDRRGEPLARTLEDRWNVHEVVPIHRVPPLLVDAFVVAEDQRFFEHRGVDWRARLHALWQNLRAGRAVRGASTLGEQVVGMLHPERHGLWGRWLEGFESQRLERRFGKGAVLEFYLNQVPFAARRRGVAQAARHYFDRDLDTLSPLESLALAALVRSPSRLDPWRAGSRRGGALERAVRRLAERMEARGLLSAAERAEVEGGRLELRAPRLPVEAPHFVTWVRGRLPGVERPPPRIATFLDGRLQQRATALLEHQLAVLAGCRAGDGAVLVADHERGEIVAWVNAGGFSAAAEGSQIDAVVVPRQPGSTLKPFLYALALERGWTAATLIDDAPFAGPVGRGLHAYRNYSRRFYGPVRLREALGNSLNVPAARTAKAVTPAAFYRLLKELGFDSLERHPEIYGEGLALGNGEVTLYELVRAYAALARGGVMRPLRVAPGLEPPGPDVRVLSEQASSLIADILADPDARRLEFGDGGVLELPVQTAVKTGTSNDYRDAWAIGFSDRHTVGVWMGNLDRREMEGVSGSIGPALVLRGVFAELRRGRPTRPLRLSPELRRLPICRVSGRRPSPGCPRTEEWFRPGRAPTAACALHGGADGAKTAAVLGSEALAGSGEEVRIAQPTPGLLLAMDPRIPDELEAFPFEIAAPRRARQVRWYVDGAPVGTTTAGEERYVWPLARGEHVVTARVWLEGDAAPRETPPVVYLVR